MPEEKLRKAKISDAKKIQSLIKYYADRNEMLHRSINDIYENIRDYVVIEDGGEVVACCCLHVCWDDLVEIKSMAVAPERLKNGLGSKLIRFEVEEAKALGTKTIFVLTFQPGFFRKHGFREVDRNSLPKKVWSECIHCVHFPDCGETALVYDLNGERGGNG